MGRCADTATHFSHQVSIYPPEKVKWRGCFFNKDITSGHSDNLTTFLASSFRFAQVLLSLLDSGWMGVGRRMKRKSILIMEIKGRIMG